MGKYRSSPPLHQQHIQRVVNQDDSDDDDAVFESDDGEYDSFSDSIANSTSEPVIKKRPRSGTDSTDESQWAQHLASRRQELMSQAPDAVCEGTRAVYTHTPREKASGFKNRKRLTEKQLRRRRSKAQSSTLCKRKATLMRKAREFYEKTGAQVLMLIHTESGLTYSYASDAMIPMIASKRGQTLISDCLTGEVRADPARLRPDLPTR